MSATNNRLLDQLMDALWAGTRAVLEGLTGLLPNQPRGQRARLLLKQLFGGTGLVFLKDNYVSQHASMLALLHQSPRPRRRPRTTRARRVRRSRPESPPGEGRRSLGVCSVVGLKKSDPYFLV